MYKHFNDYLRSLFPEYKVRYYTDYKKSTKYPLIMSAKPNNVLHREHLILKDVDGNTLRVMGTFQTSLQREYKSILYAITDYISNSNKDELVIVIDVRVSDINTKSIIKKIKDTASHVDYITVMGRTDFVHFVDEWKEHNKPTIALKKVTTDLITVSSDVSNVVKELTNIIEEVKANNMNHAKLTEYMKTIANLIKSPFIKKNSNVDNDLFNDNIKKTESIKKKVSIIQIVMNGVITSSQGKITSDVFKEFIEGIGINKFITHKVKYGNSNLVVSKYDKDSNDMPLYKSKYGNKSRYSAIGNTEYYVLNIENHVKVRIINDMSKLLNLDCKATLVNYPRAKDQLASDFTALSNDNDSISF